jgi:hypothetical protein
MESKMTALRTGFGSAVLVLALTFAGCGGGGGGEAKKAEEAPASDAKAYQPTGEEGKVSGKVSLQGDPPKYKPLTMDADAVCAKKHSGPVYPEAVVKNSNGTLRNVFVYVKGGLEGKSFAVPSDAVTLDQDGCIYKPHVLGIQARQNLKVVTSDNTAHNIHPMPKFNREWNISQAPGADPIIQSFSRPETSIFVKCNQHPWMRAYIHVLSHPFYAVTGDDGSFEIKGLPPGKYELEAVHEEYGAMTQAVDVAAKGAATSDFTYKAAQAYRPSSLQSMPALVLPCCGSK